MNDDDVIDLTQPDALERLEAASAPAPVSCTPQTPFCVVEDDGDGDDDDDMMSLSVPWKSPAASTPPTIPETLPTAPLTPLLRTNSELVEQVLRPLPSEDSTLCQPPPQQAPKTTRPRRTAEDTLPVLLLGPGADPTGAIEGAVRQDGFETQHTDFAVP